MAKKSASQVKSPNRNRENPDVVEVGDILNFSYSYCRPYFDRANKDHELYEQIIDLNNWSTMSEMTTGGAYRIVQNMMPALLFNVLWAPEYPFDLIPYDTDYSEDEDPMALALRTREWLLHVLRMRMKIDQKGVATVFDGIKLGCGYGVVEPTTIYSIDRVKTIGTTGAETKSIAGIDVAEPRTQVKYRPVPFGAILPTPDGTMPEDCTAVNHIDTVDEFTFRSMFNVEGAPFTGDPEKIIEYCRTNGYDGATFTMRAIIAKLSGFRSDHISRYGLERRKTKGITLIPIVKHYRKDKHVWVVADKFLIYKTDRTPQTLMPPVLKYSFSPESEGCWYTRGIIGPNADLIRNAEQWENAMVDYFSLHLHPHQIVNRLMLMEEERAEDLQPYAKTFVDGQPSQAQAFVVPPPLPPTAATLPDRLQGYINQNTAQHLQEASPGMMRGGSSALESINQTSTDRERMLSKHLENTWFQPLLETVLIYASMYADDEETFAVVKTENDESIQERVKSGNAKAGRNRKAGDKYFDTVRVTRDDLAHVWQVCVDFRQKLRNFQSESTFRLQVFDRLSKDPNISPDALYRYLLSDDAQVKKLLAGVDKKKRLAEIQSASQALGARPAAGGAPGAGPMAATAPGGNMGGGGETGPALAGAMGAEAMAGAGLGAGVA